MAAAEAVAGETMESNALEDTPSFSANVILPDGLGTLRLDSIPTLDTYVTLRQLLSEHPSTCCFTSYRMELEWPIASIDDEPAADLGRVVTAATGALKRVVPVSELMADLTPLLPVLCRYREAKIAAAVKGAAPPTAGVPLASLRILLENYDVRRARHHLRRLREVLVRPPVAPIVVTSGAPQAQAAAAADDEDAGGTEAAEGSDTDPCAASSSAEDAAGRGVARNALAASGDAAAPVVAAASGDDAEARGQQQQQAPAQQRGGQPQSPEFLELVLDDEVRGVDFLRALEGQIARVAEAGRRIAPLPVPLVGAPAAGTAAGTATTAVVPAAALLGDFYPSPLPLNLMEEVAAVLSNGGGFGDDGGSGAGDDECPALARRIQGHLQQRAAAAVAAERVAADKAERSSGAKEGGGGNRPRGGKVEAASLAPAALAASSTGAGGAIPGIGVPRFLLDAPAAALAPFSAAEVACLLAGPVAARQAAAALGIAPTAAAGGSGSAGGHRGGAGAAAAASAAGEGGASAQQSAASASASSSLPQCVRGIVVSGWNPPPAPRRMQGDLLYLRADTLEGAAVNITATPAGFYVNGCIDPAEGGGGGVFDPAPASAPLYSRTLWGLLSRVSPAFRRNYQALLAAAAQCVNASISHAATTWDAAFALSLAPAPAFTIQAQGAAAVAAAAAAGGSAHRGAAGAGPLPLFPSLAAAAAAAGLPTPLIASSSGASGRDGADAFGSSAMAATPAATYGIAAPPAGAFAFAKAPWLVPASFVPAIPVTAAAAAGGGVPRIAALGSGGGGGGYAHSFDGMRAEDDALCSFGMNERGAMRDWNEEWQSCKELPAASPQERLLRVRAQTKILSDFVDAATQGAMAIVAGHIFPLNPSEDARTHVYVFNAMFFSLALDSDAKEAARRTKFQQQQQQQLALTAAAALSSRTTATDVATAAEAPAAAADAAVGGGGGGVSVGAGAFEDLASLAAPNHDLAGVTALARADVPGLHTLATAVVSYSGHRFIVQSIIPGILQAEGASKMVFGSVDNGATAACEEAMRARVAESAQRLRIGSFRFTPFSATAAAADDASAASVAVDAAASGDSTVAAAAADAAAPGVAEGEPTVEDGCAAQVAGDVVPTRVIFARSLASTAPARLCGPVECKGILGSDGRHYLLDFVRATPRDAWHYETLWRAALALRSQQQQQQQPVASGAALDSAGQPLAEASQALTAANVLDAAWAAAQQPQPPAAAAAEVPTAPAPGGEAPAAAAVLSRVLAELLAGPAAPTAAAGDGDGPEGMHDAANEGLFAGVCESAYVALLRPELLERIAAKAERARLLHAQAAAEAEAAATAMAGAAAANEPGASGEANAAGADAVVPAPQDAPQALSLATGAAAGAAAATASVSLPLPEPLPPLNVNAFTRFMRGATDGAAQRAADEAAVRRASAELHAEVLPRLLKELSHAAHAPSDGEGLTRVMHARGANVRYLGRLAAMAAEAEASAAAASVSAAAAAAATAAAAGGAQAAAAAAAASASNPPPPPPFVLELLEGEMVARVARRQLDTLLRDYPACAATPAVTVAAYLNALLGWPAAAGGDGAAALAPSSSSSSSLEGGAASASVGGGKKKSKKAKVRDHHHQLHHQQEQEEADGCEASSEQPQAQLESGLGAGAFAFAHAPLYAPTVRVAFPSSDVAPPDEACRRCLRDLGLDSQAAVWRAVERDAFRHFRYVLRLWRGGGFADGGRLLARCHRLPLLRRLCQRTGVQLVARAYALPVTTAAAAAGSPVFFPGDVAGLCPVVKSCMPPDLLPAASELARKANALIVRASAAGSQAEGAAAAVSAFEHAHEALMLLYQVCGTGHAQVAECCAIAGRALSAADEPIAAVQQQQRAVILFDRVLGPDALETAQAHRSLGYSLSLAGAPNAALRHLSRFLQICHIACPPSHPSLAAGYAQLGLVYQNYAALPLAIRCYTEAAQRHSEQRAEYAMSTALAHALNCDFELAVHWGSHAYRMYRHAYGEGADKTAESMSLTLAFHSKLKDLKHTASVLQAAGISAPLLAGLVQGLPGARPATAAATAPSRSSSNNSGPPSAKVQTAQAAAAGSTSASAKGSGGRKAAGAGSKAQ